MIYSPVDSRRSGLEDEAELIGVHVAIAGSREQHRADEAELDDGAFQLCCGGVRIGRRARDVEDDESPEPTL